MVQDSPDPALTTGFIKKDCFKSNLKCRDGVCLPYPEWELFPQERSLVAKGSTSQTNTIQGDYLVRQSFSEIFRANYNDLSFVWI